MDWKQKIDNWKEQQRIKAEHQRNEAETHRLALIEAERNAEAKRVRDEMEAKLHKLAQTFHCHIHNCDVFAQKPATREKFYGSGPIGYGVPEESGSYTVEDWSRPGDLQMCEMCRKWACEKHIHKGICQECAEKL